MAETLEQARDRILQEIAMRNAPVAVAAPVAVTPEQEAKRAIILQEIASQNAAPVQGNQSGATPSPPPADRPGIVGGVARAVGQGLTFGFGDEIMAGAGASRDALNSDKPFSDAYDERLAAKRLALEQFREDRPGLATGAEIIGALPTALMGPVGVAGRAVQGGKLAKTAASALGGALGGGTYGFATGEGGARRRFEGAVPAAALGAGVGAAAPVIGKVVGKLVRKPGNRAGVPDKQIIANAPSTETLRAQSGALFDKADEARSNNSTGMYSEPFSATSRPGWPRRGWTRSIAPKGVTTWSRWRFEEFGLGQKGRLR